MRWTLALVAVAGLGTSLQGCANPIGPSPSYLGVAPQRIAPEEAAPENVTDDTIRHISSNKVLGAMAFQKVTGRSIDPERLSEGR